MQTGFIRLHVNILEHGNDRARAAVFRQGSLLARWPAEAARGPRRCGQPRSSPSGPARCSPTSATRAISNTLMIGGIGAMLILVGAGDWSTSRSALYLGELAVALEGASPVHALRRSWALARGNRMPLFAFGFASLLLQLASVAGAAAVLRRVLATVPFARAARRLRQDRGLSCSSRAASPRPPPGACGSAKPPRTSAVPGWRAQPAQPAAPRADSA